MVETFKMSISNINKSVEAQLKQNGQFLTIFEQLLENLKTELIDYQVLISFNQY
jgi:hypothetical protein